MSNLSELFGINDQSTSAVKTIYAGIGSIADIAGAVTGVAGAVDAVISIAGQSKDQLAPVIAAINTAFETLNEHQKAADISQRLTNLDNVFATAQKHLDVLKASVDAGPALDIGARIAQVGDCREAIDRLIGFDNTRAAGAFLAPFQDQVYYDDTGQYLYQNFLHTGSPNLPITLDNGYGDQAPTPQSTGLIFSQIYVLPLFLYLETLFITVGLALIPDFLNEFRGDISSDANYLMKIHDTIRDGMRFRIPAAWDAPDLFFNAWIGMARGTSAVLDDNLDMSGARIDYGALELYSGTAVGTQYLLRLTDVTSVAPSAPLATQFPPAVINSIASNPALYKKFQVRAERQRRDLYRIVGLTDVWFAANRLRALIDEPPAPGPIADYSLRTFAQAIGDAAFDTNANAYSLSRLYDIVTQTPPTDTDTRPSFVRSLRAALIN
jgi:hypothetical protein